MIERYHTLKVTVPALVNFFFGVSLRGQNDDRALVNLVSGPFFAVFGGLAVCVKTFVSI